MKYISVKIFLANIMVFVCRNKMKTFQIYYNLLNQLV